MFNLLFFMRQYLISDRSSWFKKDTQKICIFCNAIKNKKNKKSLVLYEGKEIFVLMNLFPYNVGHLMIAPKRHLKNLEDLKESEFKEMWDLIKKSLKILKRALHPVGFNIGFNIGETAAASQEHLHLHIVPRYKRDYGFMEVIAETKVLSEPPEKTFKKLLKYFKKIK